MSLVEQYLSQVGVQSHDVMKVTLFKLLMKRYETNYDVEFAGGLSAAVANYLFSDESSTAEGTAFAAQNADLIKSKAKELSSEDPLCMALTCAVYNYCYGKYVDSGHKVGMLFHPYLGFVRALQEVIRGREALNFLDSLYPKVGYENVAPLLNLWTLGLYRLLPYLPDSKNMMDEIAKFSDWSGSQQTDGGNIAA